MPDYYRLLIDKVISAAKRIHGHHATREAYQAALAAELRAEGLSVRTDVTFPDWYGGIEVCHYLDMIVADCLGIELRSAEALLPDDHYVSLLWSYVRRAGLSEGLLVNFAGAELKAVPLHLQGFYGQTA